MSAVRSITSARSKLQLSHLRPTQLELMGDDVDLKKLYIALGSADFNIQSAVTDVLVDRTIQGASTVTVTVEDQDRVLLRSGLLAKGLDTEIDGLWFRLAEVGKTGSTLTLTFEDREVAVLRTYNKPIKQSLATSRAILTRSQFVLRLLREVKEYKFALGQNVIIPDLLVRQPILSSASAPDPATKFVQRSLGIPKVNECTVKGSKMTENQRLNANTILDAGSALSMTHKELVIGIMVAIQESSLINLLPPVPGAGNFISVDPKGNPVGVFQQIPKYWAGPPHSGATRDVSTDASAFFNALAPFVKSSPNEQYYVTAERVQNSGNGTAYAQWRTEAERIVNTYGAVIGPVSAANSTVSGRDTVEPQGNYEFYRGQPPVANKKGWGKESSWDCFQRLAQEIQWRAFFVSGTFYFIDEQDLFRSQPIAIIDEDTPGVVSIDGDYIENSRSATVTVTCRMSRWPAPPGTVIQIINCGPWNGRWLVNDVSRSAFNTQGTIALKKPLPALPEPLGTNVNAQTEQTWTGTQPAQVARGSSKYRAPGPLRIVQPVPAGFNTKIVQGPHDTLGLAGYPAIDFGGSPRAPVVAVEDGYVVRFSGHDPTLGPNFGPGDSFDAHGPFGWSIYLLGDSGTEYYYTHLGSRLIPDPAGLSSGKVRVSLGDRIATVANYDLYGTPSHVHLGVHPGPSGHPDVVDLQNAKRAVGVAAV